MRLQKFLAACELGSRRYCEELIRSGRVSVNGHVVSVLGAKINPHCDKVALDGRPIALPTQKLYYLFHKPKGYLTTARDERGRPTIFDLIRNVPGRVFPVGRLDKDSEGLLILTNDGELAHRLMHPSHGVDKEYQVTVRGKMTREKCEALKRGIEWEGETLRARELEILSRGADATFLRVVLNEGKKRQIRRMCEAVGHPVVRLIRTREGPISLGDLPPGGIRPLSQKEIRELKQEAGFIAQAGTK